MSPSAAAWGFTGQREAVGLGGLYDYGARHYDAATGRFVSADTIVPDFSNPQSLNRYAYVLGNPLGYVDPDGHQHQPATIWGGNDPVVSPLTEFFGLSWEYGDVPFDAGQQASREELWAYYDAHPGYDPANDPVMRNPEAYGVHWHAAPGDVQASYNEWQAVKDGIRLLDPQLAGWVFDGVAGLASAIGGANDKLTMEAAARFQTVDPVTGVRVGKFVVNSAGDVLIVPQGGGFAGGSADGMFLETTYPNGSPYQQRHGPHGGVPYHHGHSFQIGPRRNVRGPSLDIYGNLTGRRDISAHWYLDK